MRAGGSLRTALAVLLMLGTAGPGMAADGSGPAATAAPMRPPAPTSAPVDCARPDLLGTARTIPINPAATPLHLGLETYPETLALADHEVVLTFDDGPSARTTPAVLDALRRECVEATFFLVGNQARAAPALVRREIAEGHALGSHSMTHPLSTLRFLPEAAGLREIDQGLAAVDAAGWPQGPSGRPRVAFFRFPGFADSPALLADLDRRHVAVFGCDLWAGDWNRMTPDQERAGVMASLDRHEHRGIILFHDTVPSTAAMLPALLRDLKAAGYRVVALKASDTAPAPPLTRAPPGWSSATDATIEKRRALLQTMVRPPAGPKSPAASDAAPRLRTALPGPL